MNKRQAVSNLMRVVSHFERQMAVRTYVKEGVEMQYVPSDLEVTYNQEMLDRINTVIDWLFEQ